MREYELIIDEALANGLSPLKTTPFNFPLLKECLGFRLGKAGLELYELKDNPLPVTTDVTPDWPFPQFITGEAYNFLIVRDSIVNHEDVVYSVSDDHLTITHVFSVDQLTFGQGSLIEVADFGEYAIMMNGVVMIYWNVAGAWNASLATPTIPLMNTICNFKGQAVGGGITSPWHDCDETFYIWSKIGEIDFTPDKENTAGYRRCPFGGEIYHTRRLSGDVIGYSSKGITKLTPVDSPANTFAFTELDDVGLINQGAIDAGINRHVYVGEDYILRSIDNNGITELGYESLMKELAGEDIIVSYDKKYKDFYISNSTKTFLLSPKGLTEIPQHPSAVWRRDGETYCLPEDVDDYKLTIEPYPFDFQYAGQKTSFEVETDLIGVDNPEVSIRYYKDKDNNSTISFRSLNNQNCASVMASGIALAPIIKADADSELSISYIKLRYKMTDLRSIRGVHAPAPRGQT